MSVLNRMRISLKKTGLFHGLCGWCCSGDEIEIVGSPSRPHPDSETSLSDRDMNHTIMGKKSVSDMHGHVR